MSNSSRSSRRKLAVAVAAGVVAVSFALGRAQTVSAGVLETNWFDSCGTITTDQLDSWWNGQSYYWGLGVYIKSNTGCFLPTAAWTSTASIKWALMPIWLGRTCGSINPNNPVQDGINDAGGGASPSYPNTKNDLMTAGFPQNATVALDIEGTWSSSCDLTVAGYVNGWVWQMGQWSGGQSFTVVYGSLYGAIRALSGAVGNPGMHEPYAIWAGCWTAVTNAAAGGGSTCPGNSVWNLPNIPNGNWVLDQRHHQWLSPLSGQPPPYGHWECYLGATLFVDSDAGNSVISWGGPFMPGNGDSEVNDGPVEDPGDQYAPPSYSNGYYTC